MTFLPRDKKNKGLDSKIEFLMTLLIIIIIISSFFIMKS